MKLAKGGIIDLEFIAQCAALTGKVEVEGRVSGTAENLAALKPGFADAQARQDLLAAQALYSTLTQIIRLCLTGSFDRSDVPPGLMVVAQRDGPAGFRHSRGACEGNRAHGAPTFRYVDEAEID
jgi:glutamate-ammonia-ligase adenylyltransferase